LFDSQGKLTAERATIIKNQKLSLPVELKVEELGRMAKAKNVFSFLFPEMITGSLSVSVTDADKELLSDSSENIYSAMLTQSGALKYLMSPKLASEDEADILAISNKWYGDNWQVLAKKSQLLDLKDK